MEVLVTGGAGFIGAALVDRLVAIGQNVRVLDDLSSGLVDNLRHEATLYLGSVSDEDLVRRAMDGVEVVFHQAALRAVQRSVDQPLATDRTNTHGTLAVLKAAVDVGVRRVVFASSSSVYGNTEQLPTPEDAPLAPRSPYAVTKVAGEHYCRVFADLYPIETLILRYFNVYGPRQSPQSEYALAVPLFIEALSKGRPPVVHGDGLQRRDFTYVDDVVAANLAAAAAPASCSGKAYNIAGGSPCSLLELLSILEDLIGVHFAPVHDDPRAGDVRYTSADISAAKRDLGHSPRVGLPDGLRRTVAWFRDS